MADYALTEKSGIVLRTADNAFIPNNQDNRDWVAYQGWLAAGNTPDPFVPPPPSIPVSVTRMQAMVALSRAGLLAAVQTWVAGQSAETQLIWNNAPEFSRNSTLLNNAGAALGMTPQQIDSLFVTAAAISP